MTFHIGLLLFPDLTQLDMTGPFEVFVKFPEAKVHLIWKTLDPVTASLLQARLIELGTGLRLVPALYEYEQ